MVPDHGTQYKENSSSHHGGMCEEQLDGRMTGWADGLDPILYSLILLRQSGE